MCQLYTKTEMQSVTGYKIAIKIGKSYYSPATGVKYKVGKVIKPRKQKVIASDFKDDLLDRTSRLFRKDFYGKTGVFKSREDALTAGTNLILSPQYLLDNIIPVLLQITLRGDIWDGVYLFYDIFASDYISKIVELQEITGNCPVYSFDIENIFGTKKV